MQENKLKNLQENADVVSLEYQSLQDQKKMIDERASKLQEELYNLSTHAAQRIVLETAKKGKKEVESTVNIL